jgi:hypothetical protein
MPQAALSSNLDLAVPALFYGRAELGATSPPRLVMPTQVGIHAFCLCNKAWMAALRPP